MGHVPWLIPGVSTGLPRAHQVNGATSLQDYAYGTQTDWFYMINATRFPFVFELRDTGDHGFLLPASQIESTAKEFFAAMTAMMD
ncbi:unnamed protein product, partial [Cyprideis torosa]